HGHRLHPAGAVGIRAGGAVRETNRQAEAGRVTLVNSETTIAQPALTALGWDQAFGSTFASLDLAAGVEPGRIVAERRGGSRGATATGEVSDELSGRFRFNTAVRSHLPAVGDWVALTG